jgi:hypothetical protein
MALSPCRVCVTEAVADDPERIGFTPTILPPRVEESRDNDSAPLPGGAGSVARDHRSGSRMGSRSLPSEPRLELEPPPDP